MIFSQIDQKTIDTFGVRYHMHFSVKTSFAPPRETAVVLTCFAKFQKIQLGSLVDFEKCCQTGSNAYLLAKFRFDTAENEPAKNLQKFANF